MPLIYLSTIYIYYKLIFENKNKNKNKKLSILILFVILLLISGFRPIGSDNDSTTYFSYYENLSEIWDIAEPSFAVIALTTKYLFNDFRFLIILYAALSIAIKIYAIKKLTPFIWASFSLWYSHFFFLHEYTQIRTAVAGGLLLLLIHYKNSDKNIKSFFYYLLSIIFHYSSFIFVFILFFNKKKINSFGKVIILSIIPIGFIFNIFEVNIVNTIANIFSFEKFKIYNEQDQKLNIFNSVYIFKYAFLIYITFKSDILYKNNKLSSILIKSYALSIFLYLIFSGNMAFSMRLSEITGIVEIILIPFTFYLIKNKIIWKLFIISISSAYFIFSIYWMDLIGLYRSGVVA